MKDIATILRKENVKQRIKASPYIDTLIEYLEDVGYISTTWGITDVVAYIYYTFDLKTLEGYFDTVIPTDAFVGFAFDHLELPKSVLCIEDNAFSEATIRSITFPEGLIEIFTEAFSDVKLLSDVYLPDSLTFLASLAFRDCPQLSSASIGPNIEYGGRAFTGCRKLTEITYRGTIDQWKAFIDDNDDFLDGSFIKTVKCVDGEIAVV